MDGFGVMVCGLGEVFVVVGSKTEEGRDEREIESCGGGSDGVAENWCVGDGGVAVACEG